MKYNNLISISTLMLCGCVSLISCQNEENLNSANKSEKVMLTVSVNRGEEQTRTSFSEENGNLKCVWSENDKLIVTDKQGNNIGYLAIENPSDGTYDSEEVFSGEVTIGNEDQADVNIVYLGSSFQTDKDASESKSYDISNQDGTLKNLAENDFLRAAAIVVRKDGSLDQATAVDATSNASTVNMSRALAFGKFKLAGSLPTLAAGDKITITGDNLITSYTGTFGSTDGSDANYTVGAKKGTITLTLPDETGVFYLAMIPSEDVEPTFSMINGDYIYTAKLGSHTWQSNQYVLKNSNPIEIIMECKANPADMDNWGGNHGSTGSAVTSLTFIGRNSSLDDQAWASSENWGYSFGGWKKTTSDRFNAIKDGHLISWDYGNNVEAKYFQYGRLLGFPKDAIYAVCSMTGYYANFRYAKYPFGMSEWTDVNCYYCWDMDSRPTYAYSSAHKSGMEIQQAINSSIIYVCGDLVDYLKSSYRSKNWSERSGNPCPDNYRVPSKEELNVFVPTKKFTSSLVEMKTIYGVNYAVRWRKLTATTVGVTIVQSNQKITSTNDKIFENTKELVLNASGLIFPDDEYDAVYSTGFYDDNDKLASYVGYYWSSDITYNKEYKGYYAWAMRIEMDITGDGVTIEWDEMEPVCGLQVIPIKDDKAKATGFRPWFPNGSV